MTGFINYLINGISLGSVYAIIALGYTMVYGIAKMLNFAHGDIIMVGSYVVFITTHSMGMPVFLSVLLSVIVCTVLGIVIERVAYKPLRDASPLSVLITAIGVSYLLQNVALLLFGADTKSFTSVVTIPALKFADGAITVTGETLVTIVSCIVIMIGLTTFINKTKAGQAMLAVSEDRGAATLMGVNVNGTTALTFAIGSALAAVAGVLLCSAYPSLTPYTGSMPGIKAFVAAVFGGIGSIPGALIGGILLGIIEILSKAFISSALRRDRILRPDHRPLSTSDRNPGQKTERESVGDSHEKYSKKETLYQQYDHPRHGRCCLDHHGSAHGHRTCIQPFKGTPRSFLYLRDHGGFLKPDRRNPR